MKARIIAFFILSLLCFAANATAENLVVNGSFSNQTYYCLPDSNGDCNTVSGPGAGVDTVADGWYLLPPSSGSDFAVENSPYTGQGSNYYAAFMSASGATDQDCFLTILNTTPMQQYTVSFSVEITSPSVSNTSLFPQWQWNEAGATPMTETQYYSPAAGTDFGWTSFSFTETALTASTNLMFHGTDANGAILLDNVSVTEASSTPEPLSIWMMAIGSVLLGSLRGAIRRFP
jgi:hypothetical protein